ncbi:MAG TPA: hypothetical protein VGF55_33140 [Gemmataceae bacterium]|jgi:hypothetical protein
MASQWRKTAQFVATDTAGRKHTVYERTQFVDTTNSEDGPGDVPNLISYKLANGTQLNKVGPGRFRTVGSMPDFDLTSADPKAA